MSQKEWKRYKVIYQWIDGYITGAQAADFLGLSMRQVYRLKKRVLEEGEKGLIHKNRGRKPAHALSDAQRQHILELHQSERYKNCNDVHFAELLAQYEGIEVSPSTVRRIRQEAKIKPKRKRRSPKVHRPRERKAQFGMLVQIDGSPHRWLEERAPEMSLLAAVDDATGAILGAVFRPQEDAEGYFRLIKQMVEKYGIPMSVYSDRHRIFQSPKETPTIEQELAGGSPRFTQFGQALSDLGVDHIKAQTPQAKGRIERLFQTLQDRWVTELRIRGIRTLEEANRILPQLIREHNRRFAVKPKETSCAFVPLGRGQSLDDLLCFRERRTIGPGETIAFHNKTYTIDRANAKQTIPLRTKVEVRKTLDGEVFVWHNGQAYPLREISKPQSPSSPKRKKASSERKSHKPAHNHPWRQYRRTLAKTRVSQRA